MTQSQAGALIKLCKTYWPYDKGCQVMTGEAAYLLLRNADARAARDFVLGKAKQGERFAPTIGQIYAASGPPEEKSSTKIDVEAIHWVAAWGNAVDSGYDVNEACRIADESVRDEVRRWQ